MLQLPCKLAAAGAFALAVAVLLPTSLTVPRHADEDQYIWSAAYYGARVAQLDFRRSGSSAVRDPGWDPLNYWALTQPMGARAVYAVAMYVARAPGPDLPFIYSPLAVNGPATVPTPYTLLVCRLAGLACAALGFALISLRLGWRGIAVTAVMLALPDVRGDLARAWAEGPLLFGFGLAFIAYRTRWFAVAAGVGATFKLTALGLWPVVFLCSSVGRSRFRHVLSVLLSATVWTLLTPPAWFYGGPAYLMLMLLSRGAQYAGQVRDYGRGPLGLWIPSRYIWPVELALVLIAVEIMPKACHWCLDRSSFGRSRVWPRASEVTPSKS